MVTNEAKGLCRGRLPAGWRKLPQVVLVGHAGQPGQDIAQVGERVLAVTLAGYDQRVEDAGQVGRFQLDVATVTVAALLGHDRKPVEAIDDKLELNQSRWSRPIAVVSLS